MKSFETERQLVDSFTDFLNRTNQNRFVRIFHEFETRNGIADVVLANLLDARASNLKIGHYNPRWIAAIAAISPNLEFTSESFADLTGLPLRPAGMALKAFSIEGYVKLIGPDLYQRTAALIPIVNEICAVEAKLRDWSRALHQAYRYQDFATQSWVLLDTKHIEPAKTNIDKFKRLNVGLASIGVNNFVYIYFSPQTLAPRFQERFWMANCLIARTLHNVTSFHRKHLSP